MGIFQERTGSDGDRALCRLEKGEEIGYQRIRQLGTKEMLQNLVVARITEGYRIEIVALHEVIKDVGTEHHGLRNLHRGILILIELRMALDDIVEESQAPTLAAQRAFADTGKVGVLIKLHAVEDCHNAQVLHVTILHDGIKDNLAMGIHILQPLPCNILQES